LCWRRQQQQQLLLLLLLLLLKARQPGVLLVLGLLQQQAPEAPNRVPLLSAVCFPMAEDHVHWAR
jgi:hypothetical protein